MVVVYFHCPFVGLSGCHDGGGNMLTKTSLITHLRDRHWNGDAQVITKKSLTANLAVFEVTKVLFKHTGLWLCRVCFKTHTFHAKCRHGDGSTFVPPQIVVMVRLLSKVLFMVKCIPPRCHLGFSRVLKGALDKVICKLNDITCWVSLLVLHLYLLKTFCPRNNIQFLSSGVASYSNATLADLKAKHVDFAM
ncbi:hypothetical protein Tco_1121519 [Tanacetum coccineum]|uniref:Uncharacterized protein n=1 Tax=Tanacetum coccineum TaxID=301880 RepID=A0ABQ5IY50_9ASTR